MYSMCRFRWWRSGCNRFRLKMMINEYLLLMKRYVVPKW